MPPKIKQAFVCTDCGAQSAKWAGRCSQCGAWNTLQEEIIAFEKPGAHSPVNLDSAIAEAVNDIDTGDEYRYRTGIGELDRVLGGGIVKGSITLLSGDPGIGKSTLLMQICGALCVNNSILYVSGEESGKQLKLRADRLGVTGEKLFIMAQREVMIIAEYIRTTKPNMVMVDSIQTMAIGELSSSCGSVTQVRECTNVLMRVGKELDIPIIIVGHVNKDGAIAGPKVMEHIVDAVLYFEGERNYSYRILRAVKNRYGSTNEIGVFEMLETGLMEVENPSMAMLSGRMTNVSGSCVACVLEGSRPILAEVQGLVTSTGFGNPRRMATGFDYNRMNLLLAVLEKRMGFFFANLDAYLNIVGGLKLDEPAADLPIVLALISGLKDVPVPEDLVAFGEIGLTGEIRSVPRALARVSELERLGFKRCVLPNDCARQIGDSCKTIELIGVRNVRDAINAIFQ